MDVIGHTANGDERDLCCACHPSHGIPDLFSIGDEREAVFGAEYAMNVIDVVCMCHGVGRYAASNLPFLRSSPGLRPGLPN